MSSICFVCGEATTNVYPLCDCCKPSVLSERRICIMCGHPTSRFVKICDRCLSSVGVYNNYSLFFYSSRAKDILSLYKFNKVYSFSNYYSELIIDYVNNNLVDPVICPVPTSLVKRKIKNGYQLDYIVTLLKRSGLTVSFLIKKRHSKTQKKLNRADRVSNLEGMFYSSGKQVDKSRTVLLIDDVYTTGATVNCCCRVLEDLGYENIQILTLCRD